MSSSALPAARDRAPLRRPRACAVSGTSEALAAHLGWGTTAVRMILVLLTLLWGAGALLYAWIWVFTPWQEGMPRPRDACPWRGFSPARPAWGSSRRPRRSSAPHRRSCP
nr:hypothetical protein GCM10025699_02090 [Microbacterium flavescens]